MLGTPREPALDTSRTEAHYGVISRALYKRSMSIQASRHRPYELPKGMTAARSMQSNLQRAPSSVCGVNCGAVQAEEKDDCECEKAQSLHVDTSDLLGCDSLPDTFSASK